MPPKKSKEEKKKKNEVHHASGGSGRLKGNKGKGKAKVKANGNGKGGHVPSELNSAQITEFDIPGESRSSKMRKITNTVSVHRVGNDLMARALIAPGNAVTGARAQLRYLQFAENVVENSLFTNVFDDNDENDVLSERPTLFSCLTEVEEQGHVNEAVLSMLTVQSTMLASQNEMLTVRKRF